MSEEFIKQLTENQNQLYGYVFSLLGDHNQAADVVQETNLVLWRKLDEFDSRRPFLPWAYAIARFQVLAHLRDHKRDRLLLDAELVEAMSGKIEQQANHLEAIRNALRSCIRELTPANRELIESRYHRYLSVGEIATMTTRTEGAVKVALLRIRRQLSECIQKRMAVEG